MALNKYGMDLKAINRDQKAIDRLPNKGRVKSEVAKKMRKVPQSTKDADVAYQSDKKNGYLGHFPHAKNNPVLKSWSRNQK
jgi:hypothetical protein